MDEQIEQQKICEMDIDEELKKVLAYLLRPRGISDVAAVFNRSYSYTYQTLAIMMSKGWIKKSSSLGGKSMYKLNTENVIP